MKGWSSGRKPMAAGCLTSWKRLTCAALRAIRGRGLMVGLELRGRVTPVLKALQECGVLRCRPD